MRQELNRHGNLEIEIFEVHNEEDRSQFMYWYTGLERHVKKRIENAFYQALVSGLVERKRPPVSHKQGGINIIEIHVEDIVDNLNVIKHLIEPTEEIIFQPTVVPPIDEEVE